jgi:hypothetical protein
MSPLLYQLSYAARSTIIIVVSSKRCQVKQQHGSPHRIETQVCFAGCVEHHFDEILKPQVDKIPFLWYGLKEEEEATNDSYI